MGITTLHIIRYHDFEILVYKACIDGKCMTYTEVFSLTSFQGGHIIFFQSLSLLGYCLFPLDIGALICMLKDNVIVKVIVVCVTLAWSSWAAYPFMSSAVNPRRKALALYPVFLMYVSVGFLIIAINWNSFPLGVPKELSKLIWSYTGMSCGYCNFWPDTISLKAHSANMIY